MGEVGNASTESTFYIPKVIMSKNWRKKPNQKENFQTKIHFFTFGMNKNENFKEKTRQTKFQPYQVLARKRTKDVKSQTGPWPNFSGPFYTDIKDQGKVSVFMTEWKNRDHRK